MELLKKIKLLYFLLLGAGAFAQSPYQLSVSTTAEECLKGAAALRITGTQPADTISIAWSSGQNNVYEIHNADAGNYFVLVHIHSADTTINRLDTALNFSIGKTMCRVSVGNHFTPNGDGYNDVLQIVNIQNYPNFELEIFNKWGQRIHQQKASYTPWDGTWLGTRVPDGTYYYILFYDANDKGQLLKGDITILR